MALNVSMTGSGTIGDIASGWTANEYTNSNVIGETGAGTGSVSFTARSNDDSLLVINNDTISTINDLGNLHGIVQSVSETGVNVNVTHGTVADKLNLDVDVPPVVQGGPKAWCAALEYAIGIGPNPYNEPVSYVPTYALDGTSFPFFYSTGSDDYKYSLNQFLNDTNGLSAAATYDIGLATLDSTQGTWSGTGTQTTAELEAINTIPSWFQLKGNQYSVMQFSVLPDSSTRIGFVFDSGFAGSDAYAVILDGNAKTLGYLTNNISYSTLDDTEPIMVTMIMYTEAVFATNYWSVDTYITDHTNTKISSSVGSGQFGDLGTKLFIPAHRLEANDIRYFNFFTTNKSYSVSSITNYIAPVDIPNSTSLTLFDFTNYTGTSLSAYSATTGVGWELLQQLASAENFEVAISGDKILVRDIGTTIFDITNKTVPTINPSSTLTGKQVDVTYNNAEFISGVIYDAQADGNNIISVEAGGSTITSVKFEVDPIYVVQPTRYLATGTGTGAKFVGPLPDGSYFVVDSTGLPISEDQWEDYGGSIYVGIDPEDNSAIQIIVTGPYVEIPSTTGPYYLSADDGEGSFAALKLLGAGVYAVDNVLSIQTAIDADKYTRGIVSSINNPFIATEQQAYDRGVWASLRASGPNVNISFSIPVSSIQGVGLTCGSLINYRESTYRITSCSIGSVSASIQAEWLSTIDDIDTLWSGETVADYDSVWSSYQCQDQVIVPYKVA